MDTIQSGSHRTAINYVICISLIALIQGCNLLVPVSDSSSETTDLRVTGLITSSADGKPIPNAKIELYDSGLFSSKLMKYVTSNWAGKYDLRITIQGHCPSSGFTIRFEAFGYLHQSLSSWDPDDEDYVRCTSDLQTIDVQLAPLNQN